MFEFIKTYFQNCVFNSQLSIFVYYIMPVLFVIDVTWTYFNVKKFRELYPQKDFYQLELNPIVKMCWRKFGLKLGTILSCFITFPLLLFMMFFLPRELMYTFLGIYWIVIVFHWSNWKTFHEEEEKRVNIIV